MVRDWSYEHWESFKLPCVNWLVYSLHEPSGSSIDFGGQLGGGY